jgi:uncharacterized membrane protein YfcA
MGAWAGEQIHTRISPRMIRTLYAAMVGLIGLRVWLTILGF